MNLNRIRFNALRWSYFINTNKNENGILSEGAAADRRKHYLAPMKKVPVNQILLNSYKPLVHAFWLNSGSTSFPQHLASSRPVLTDVHPKCKSEREHVGTRSYGCSAWNLSFFWIKLTQYAPNCNNVTGDRKLSWKDNFVFLHFSTVGKHGYSGVVLLKQAASKAESSI